MQRRGYTLAEVVTASTVLSVLLLACGATIGMAERSVGDAGLKTGAQLQAADGVSQLTDDLNVATNFTQRTATSVTFTVPDRLAAGTPQPVTYAWTGNTGDPLTRSFNNGPATMIVPAVRSLAFGYATRTLGPTPKPAEQVIASHDTVIGSAANYSVTDKNWACQSFTPSLPLGTASWTLTHLRLYMKVGAIEQAITVAVTLPDVMSHPAAVLASATVYDSALSGNFEWIDVPISGLSGLNPAQSLCIKISPANGGKNVGSVQYDSALLNVLGGAVWSTSSNSGSTWSTGLGTNCARFYVFGTLP